MEDEEGKAKDETKERKRTLEKGRIMIEKGIEEIEATISQRGGLNTDTAELQQMQVREAV